MRKHLFKKHTPITSTDLNEKDEDEVMSDATSADTDNVDASNAQAPPPASFGPGHDALSLGGLNVPKGRKRPGRDYSAVPWTGFFEQRHLVEVGDDGDAFMTYWSGDIDADADADTPVLVLVHGGGHSSLSWALMVQALRGDAPADAASSTTGNTTDMSTSTAADTSEANHRGDFNPSMTPATRVDPATVPLMATAPWLKKAPSMSARGAAAPKIRPPVLAIDLRQHGDTKTKDEENLSLERLCADLVDVMNTCLAAPDGRKRRIVLVGHSLGGAIVSHVASSHTDRLETSLEVVGLCVLDVVEGTAVAALPVMKSVLSKRPEMFRCVEDAIKWACKNGQVRNAASARVSVPPQVREEADGTFRWRTDLPASEPYWQAWFEGLSKVFLSAKVPKLLILAGTDRLDKELTVGQMQGRFQLILNPSCGHLIMEDEPRKTAIQLLEFLQRQCAKREIPVFIKKS